MAGTTWRMGGVEWLLLVALAMTESRAKV